MRYGSALREQIRTPGTTPLVGIYDMYSASVAARHYDGFFVSGFGFAASHYGLPDIGFIAWPDMVAFAASWSGAPGGLPPSAPAGVRPARTSMTRAEF
ncbi:hypothetical protein ACWEQJ_36420, partial [Streptomyces cyaneofuscatus]